MKKPLLTTVSLLCGLQSIAFGKGVSPYLPLHLEPEIESQIERVLILANEPAMTRPIATATVLEALPKACKYDQALCEQVERYLRRFMHSGGITRASVEGASISGSGRQTIAPNRYGMQEDSRWNTSAQGYVQLSDHVLLNAGVNAYQGKTDFTGSMISLGYSYAQLDIGYRPHWLSPMTDSSMLMSTEAPTMPSVTLSNYEPLTRFGLHYELFAARMSESQRIVLGDGLTQGHPTLGGFHLDGEPARGWSLGVNRLYQFGGGALGGNGLRRLISGLFSPNAGHQTSNAAQQVGNTEASITSQLVFPARVPFSVYFEYAGEDTSRGKPYLLGNAALSAGIHFPRLWRRFDLTLETSEWQNAWYVHSVYLDGLTNYQRVVGAWFGDQRILGDAVGGRSSMASLGWNAPFGGLFQLRYRTLQDQVYTGDGYLRFPYKRFHEISVSYSRPVLGVIVGGEVDSGRDVFGGNFTRLAGFVRYDGHDSMADSIAASMSDEDEQPEFRDGEIFVDVGANANRQNIDLITATTRYNGPVRYSGHFALGARRFVSDHSDLGARVEYDNIQGHSLIGARALDYRYRFKGPLALSVFVGAARYNLATPAYGLYYGGGLQWRNLLPHWDVGFDYRYANSVARDHLQAGDPPNSGDRSDSFYNISIFTLSVSRTF